MKLLGKTNACTYYVIIMEIKPHKKRLHMHKYINKYYTMRSHTYIYNINQLNTNIKIPSYIIMYNIKYCIVIYAKCDRMWSNATD